MKKFFFAAVAVAVLFTVESCNGDDPVVTPPPQTITEDTSGYGTIIFQSIDDPTNRYDIRIDGKTVAEKWLGNEVFVKDSVKAGLRILYAEQTSGMAPGTPFKYKTEVLKVLTDSVYTWQFPKID